MPDLTRKESIILVVIFFILIFSLHLSYLLFIEFPNRDLEKEGFDFHGFKLFGDEIDYVRIGYNIYHNGVFGQNKGNPSGYRPPLWPFTLSIMFRFTDNILYGMILNHLLFALVSVFAYIFSSLFFSTRASLLTMIVVGLNPNTYSYVRLYTEALFSLLLIISIIYFALSINTDSLWNPIFCGIFIGLLSLTRAEGVLMIILFFLYFLYCSLTHKLKPMAVMLFLILATVTVTPWVVRNYVIIGYPGISSNSGEVFAGAHNKRILSSDPGDWINFDSYANSEEKKLRGRLSELEINRYLWQRGFKDLKDISWPFFLNLELNKLRLTFMPYFKLLPEQYPWIINLLISLPYIILWLLFVVLSFKWLYYAEKWRIFLIPYLVPLTVTLIFYGYSRFRVPYEPIAFSLTIGYFNLWLTGELQKPSA